MPHPKGHMHGTCRVCSASFDSLEELYHALKWFVENIEATTMWPEYISNVDRAKEILEKAAKINEWLEE